MNAHERRNEGVAWAQHLRETEFLADVEDATATPGLQALFDSSHAEKKRLIDEFLDGRGDVHAMPAERRARHLATLATVFEADEFKSAVPRASAAEAPDALVGKFADAVRAQLNALPADRYTERLSKLFTPGDRRTMRQRMAIAHTDEETLEAIHAALDKDCTIPAIALACGNSIEMVEDATLALSHNYSRESKSPLYKAAWEGANLVELASRARLSAHGTRLLQDAACRPKGGRYDSEIGSLHFRHAKDAIENENEEALRQVTDAMSARGIPAARIEQMLGDVRNRIDEDRTSFLPRTAGPGGGN